MAGSYRHKGLTGGLGLAQSDIRSGRKRPAISVKVFRLEGIRGWHTVIVEHPTARAMRLREPDTGVSVEHVQGIEDCEPVATTTE